MGMMYKLSETQQALLQSIASGRFLKSQRYLNGRKLFKLYASDNTPLTTVRRSTVEALCQRGLLYSNQKFPAATFNLTPQGKKLVDQTK